MNFKSIYPRGCLNDSFKLFKTLNPKFNTMTTFFNPNQIATVLLIMLFFISAIRTFGAVIEASWRNKQAKIISFTLLAFTLACCAVSYYYDLRNYGTPFAFEFLIPSFIFCANIFAQYEIVRLKSPAMKSYLTKVRTH